MRAGQGQEGREKPGEGDIVMLGQDKDCQG